MENDDDKEEAPDEEEEEHEEDDDDKHFDGVILEWRLMAPENDLRCWMILVASIASFSMLLATLAGVGKVPPPLPMYPNGFFLAILMYLFDEEHSRESNKLQVLAEESSTEQGDLVNKDLRYILEALSF